jgi:hypothetical protein
MPARQLSDYQAGFGPPFLMPVAASFIEMPPVVLRIFCPGTGPEREGGHGHLSNPEPVPDRNAFLFEA